MAYRILKSDKSLTAALRRITDEQLGRAIAASDRPPEEADEAIHDIRKRCKKLRGLLRLVRAGFDDYADENRAVRDAARLSSSLRDAGVLLKTFDALLAETDPAPYAALRVALGGETGAELSPDEVSETLATQRLALKEIHARSRDWKVRGGTGTVLYAGLSRSWSHAVRDMEATGSGATPEIFHDWRKRVKDHWYHSRLLQGFWPEGIRPHRKAVKELSELLGRYQDLTVFLERLDQAHLPSEVEDMRRRAIARRDTLAYESRALGAKIFQGAPEDLPDEWARHWRKWASSR